MFSEIDRWLSWFERGKITRRQLAARLVGMAAAVAGTAAGQPAASATPDSTFQATSLNHLALRVSDPQRSAKFYRDHLGLKPLSSGPSNTFLRCGPHFLALFRDDQPRMDHYCYTIADYRQQSAARALREVGLEPELVADRIYFRDPDGHRVQLSAVNDWDDLPGPA